MSNSTDAAAKVDPDALDAWDFDLPATQIAQFPAEPRDSARLLRIDRKTGQIADHSVADLAELLPDSAVLVVNNTKVVAARLLANKQTGGRVELLLAAPSPAARALGQTALYRTAKKLRAGTLLELPAGITATVTEVLPGGRAVVDFAGADTVGDVLQQCGAVPLPPYIRGGVETEADRRAYQCVYAANEGAVAAPTAGLHFTAKLLRSLARRGVTIEMVTLHVGPGTFMPVRVANIREHSVLAERYELDGPTAAVLTKAKHDQRPIIAVGTTTTRVLESAWKPDMSAFEAGAGETRLTILPGHSFAAIDGLMTNFHLPRSSLLLLVGAFCGRGSILSAYNHAVAAGYRFYSYGDATLIL